MAWSVDRLGRNLQDLVGFLSELHALKIDLFLRQQGLDTTTPAGKALFQMMGVFAEFERAKIAERVRAGLARARGEGKRLGRPHLPRSQQGAIQVTLSRKGAKSRTTVMAVQQNTDHIQTTHIGSLPRPHNLLDLLKAKYAGQHYDERELNSVLARGSPTACASRSSAALRS
jgi:DNA invertase Pin-like site-specific DNA recombinase